MACDEPDRSAPESPPAAREGVGDIRVIRSNLVNRFLVFFALLGPLGVAGSLVRVPEAGWQPLFVVHILLGLVAIACAIFRHQLPYGLRVAIVLGNCFLAGVGGLAAFGLMSPAGVVLYTFLLLAAIAYGSRAGLLATTASVLAFAMFGTLVYIGLWQYSYDAAEYSVSPIAWVIYIVAIVVLAPMTVIAFGTINDQLTCSLDALRNSEARNRSFLEAIPDLMFILDRQGVHLDFFAPHGSHLLANPEALLGRRANELLPRDAAEAYMRSIEETLRTRSITVFEYELDFEDDVQRAFEGRMVPHGENNVLVFVRDITEQRSADVEIQRLALVVEQSSELVVMTDTTGEITYVNPAFESTTGYTSEEALGQNVRALQDDTSLLDTMDELWTTLNRGERWTGQFTNWRKDKTSFTVNATISPLRAPSGNIVSFVAVMRDVTRELELEEQFFQSQKMEAVGQLAGGVAHDFNNLLQVIQGYCQMMVDDVPDARAQDDLAQVVDATDKAAVLVRQLLAYSRKQVLALETLDFDGVISALSQMLQRVIGEHIAFSFTPAPGYKTVQADKGQLEQVLVNLCINARDAMGDSGKLTITTENADLDEKFCEIHDIDVPGPYVVLSVSDTGCGMSPETQRRIFEPFFTTKAPGKGTGLGLSTVFGIVRQHNGWIHAYSEEGIGTTFRVYLPAVTDAVSKTEEPKDTQPLGSGECILLADDDEGVRGVVEIMLRRAGYHVLTAVDGDEAVRLFEQHRDQIDLALLDVVMPGLGGKGVYEHIRSVRPELPVLFSSGYSEEGIHHNFVLDDGMQLIQKPYQRRALLERVRALLDG